MDALDSSCQHVFGPAQGPRAFFLQVMLSPPSEAPSPIPLSQRLLEASVSSCPSGLPGAPKLKAVDASRCKSRLSVSLLRFLLT